MGRIEKTVFISYRRTNVPWALAIYQDLTIHGYDVFFDYQSIKSGDFEQVILGNIKARAHFLVILTPSALERCNEPGDWLRREIETALEEHRNIVPLMLEGFDFGASNTVKALTGKLALLIGFNGLSVPAEYFFEAMDRLRGKYLDVALSDIHLYPLNRNAKEATETQKTAANKAPQVDEKQLTAQQWFERGYLFTEANNLDDAMRCYSEAIYLKPDYADAYINRGLTYGELGDHDSEIKDYDEAIRLKPDFVISYNNRGVAYGELDDYDSAIKDFGEAIRLKPDYADAYNNRGALRGRKGDYDGAIKDFDEAIRLKPDDAKTYNNLGVTYGAIGEFESAIKNYAKAIRIKLDYVDAYYGRGVALSFKGDNLSALHDFQKASELKPDNGRYRVSLIRVLYAVSYIEEAKKQEQVAREIIRNETEYDQACLEAICGNKDKALELLKVGLEKRQEKKGWILLDPDLENIRKDPRFKALVTEFED